MKSAFASVVAASVASICCIGPVVLVLAGAGAFGASLSSMERYRPPLLIVTAAFLGFAFYSAYRPASDCAADCQTSAHTRDRIVVWLAAAITIVLVAFPYYVSYLF